MPRYNIHVESLTPEENEELNRRANKDKESMFSEEETARMQERTNRAMEAARIHRRNEGTKSNTVVNQNVTQNGEHCINYDKAPEGLHIGDTYHQ